MRRLLLALLFLAGLPGAAYAAPGFLEASWIEPTTNVDNSRLLHLWGYRVYVSPAVCPVGTYQFVPGAAAAPPANHRVDYQILGLTAGATYTVRVTAVDIWALESACSNATTAVARPGGAPLPVIDLGVRFAP